MAKKRLDVLVTERGLAESRQKAQALIMAGEVFSGDRKLDKAGMNVEDTIPLEVRGNTLRYVGRGGLKLEKAMEVFPLDLHGFTDCMLQNGVKKVYSVDVGYGELAWKLRSDERVIVLERTTARYLSRAQVPDPLDFASVDVSFISLKLIFPALHDLLRERGQVVSLIKPQFEAGREFVGKKGIVRDPKVHRMVLEQYLEHAEAADFSVLDLTYSPITGQEGNIEYLGFLEKGAGRGRRLDLQAVIDASHRAFRGEG